MQRSVLFLPIGSSCQLSVRPLARRSLRRRQGPLAPILRSATLSMALVAGLAVVAAGPVVAADIPSAEEMRPPGLVLLEEKLMMEGKQAFGIVAATADPTEPGLWRVKVWDELPDRALVRHETVRCLPGNPMRVTNDGRQLQVRFLNPGGPIHPGNRRDHLLWWAVCFPDQAGRDPAQLGATARRLGFSGQLVERELVVPSGQR